MEEMPLRNRNVRPSTFLENAFNALRREIGDNPLVDAESLRDCLDVMAGQLPAIKATEERLGLMIGEAHSQVRLTGNNVVPFRRRE